jgi:hypothetical protein
MPYTRLVPRAIAFAVLALATGCLWDSVECSDGSGLVITSPAAGATLDGGQIATITFRYTSVYAYDTLELRADGGPVCSVDLTGPSYTGGCQWNPTGVAPGPVEIQLIARDVRTTPVCEWVSRSTTVTVAASAPVVVTDPADVTVEEGDAASFGATVRGTGPLDLRWQRSDDDGASYQSVPGAGGMSLTLATTTASDDGARFRLTATNPEGTATSAHATLTVIAGCPVPPLPELDRTAPTGTAPAATLGANLTVNPGFESVVWVGLQPTAFGYWRFDESATVQAQQGIAPRSGDRMLQFVSASRDVALFGSADSSEQIQLVDVSDLQEAIDGAGVRVRASAHFARVAGCATTDDAFGIFAIAFDGDIADYQTRWANGIAAATAQGVDRDLADMTGVDGWLLHRRARLRHNDPSDRIATGAGDVFTWREVAVEEDLPAGTTFLVIVLYASENVVNDTAYPEFHGHYADDATVVLSPRAP